MGGEKGRELVAIVTNWPTNPCHPNQPVSARAAMASSVMSARPCNAQTQREEKRNDADEIPGHYEDSFLASVRSARPMILWVCASAFSFQRRQSCFAHCGCDLLASLIQFDTESWT